MTIDEEFVGAQRKLLSLVLQSSRGSSRFYSEALRQHFGCTQARPAPKDFRKHLRAFLTLLDEKMPFSAKEKETFRESCRVLEKENKPTCCRAF